MNQKRCLILISIRRLLFITILRNIKEVNEIMRFLYPKYRRNRLTAQRTGGSYNDQSNYCSQSRMSTPRKHHYLPQFYLEGFKVEPQKGKKPHIWQIEKDGDQAFYSPAIEDTGCIRDYHTLDFTDEDPDHKAVEAQLSKLESEQAVLLRAIRETKRIEASQVEPLSAFISLMRYRVPSFADHVEKSLRSVVLDRFKSCIKRESSALRLLSYKSCLIVKVSMRRFRSASRIGRY